MAFAVVACPQLRARQPIVGDVDPLRAIVDVDTTPGHVRMVPFEEGPPGDLDRLEAGIERELEPGIEVVGGQHRARGHRPVMLAGAGTPPSDPAAPGSAPSAPADEGLDVLDRSRRTFPGC